MKATGSDFSSAFFPFGSFYFHSLDVPTKLYITNFMLLATRPTLFCDADQENVWKWIENIESCALFQDTKSSPCVVRHVIHSKYTSWLCHSKFEFFSNVHAACDVSQAYIWIANDATWKKIVRCCTNEKYHAINVMFYYWVMRKVFFSVMKKKEKSFSSACLFTIISLLFFIIMRFSLHFYWNRVHS